MPVRLGSYVRSPGTCEFAFAVPVPDGTSFQVEVAHRGKVAVSRTDVGAVSLALAPGAAAG